MILNLKNLTFFMLMAIGIAGCHKHENPDPSDPDTHPHAQILYPSEKDTLRGGKTDSLRVKFWHRDQLHGIYITVQDTATDSVYFSYQEHTHATAIEKALAFSPPANLRAVLRVVAVCADHNNLEGRDERLILLVPE